MSAKNWTVELEKLDYQGFYKTDKKGKEEKVVGRNHLLLIANGYVGIRGCLAELFDDKMDSSTHVIGIYDQVGYEDPEKDIWKEIINMPDFMSAPMTFDGEPVFLDRDGKNTEEFSLWLDMKSATLHLNYIWKSKSGKRLQVDLERFCAYHEKNLVYNRTTFTSLDGKGKLEYIAGISGDVHDAHGPHLESFHTQECEGGYILTACTQQHKYKVAISSKHSVSEETKSRITTGSSTVKEVFDLGLNKDKAVTITSQHTLYTSRDSMDPVADALRASYDYDSERKKHLDTLEKHWEIANVEIDVDEAYVDTYLKSEIEPVVEDRVNREVKYGTVAKEDRQSRIDKELAAELVRVKKSETFMRYNLYILLVSIPKNYDYAAIPSRSLSYATYKGAIFWEVDTYAFPFYALVYPSYAKNILHYRYKGLEYAIKKAQDLGYQGAFFAWESLDTGEEATKKFVWQDIHSGRMMRNYFGDRQWHIAGDVIYATWQYYEVTGDWDFMENYGSHMTLLTARFIGSLVHYKVTKDRYEILHTCCPDEYHEEVANNAFTNRILRFVLEKTFELVEQMSEKCPAKLDQLFLKYKISEEELEYWEDVMEKLYIPEPHPENRVIEQHDGYFDLEDISLEEFRSRIIRDEYLGYPVGPAVHTQVIKQADTVQMLVMFKKEFHPVVRLATFDYYDLRTEHGSGDSPNAYGIVAAQVGRLDRALWYFLRSARIDLESANPARKANFQLGGVHIAPSGGTWQVIHYGFAGFETEDNTLKFNPIVPKGWNRIKYNFFYRQQKLTVQIDRHKITLESDNKNREDLKVQVNDQALLTLKPGKKHSAEYKKMGNHYYTYNELGVQIKKEMN
jgi:kojibiose phosphorylase